MTLLSFSLCNIDLDPIYTHFFIHLHPKLVSSMEKIEWLSAEKKKIKQKKKMMNIMTRESMTQQYTIAVYLNEYIIVFDSMEIRKHFWHECIKLINFCTAEYLLTPFQMYYLIKLVLNINNLLKYESYLINLLCCINS